MAKKYIKITAKMSTDETKTLFNFLSKQTANTKYWKANQVYQFGSDQITLSHDVIWRKRNKDNKTGNRYEVISTNQVGIGSFGTVYDIEGTLALDTNLEFKQNKSRVVKIQTHYDHKYSISQLQNEYKITQKASHMGVKEPTVVDNRSATVMKKMKGKTLREIIQDDVSGKYVLSIKQRLQLSLALLKALKGQVTDKGIIHRDIRPENIMIDLQNPITVNIIDFGTSTLTSSSDNKACGTPGYAPFEAFLGIMTTKMDVFSMACVMGPLWHDDLIYYNYKVTGTMMAEDNASPANSEHLFLGINLSDHNKAIIRSTLSNMSKEECHDRITLEEAIQAFETVQQDIQEQIDNILHHLEALRLKKKNLQKRGFNDLGLKYFELADKLELKTKEFHAMKPEERKQCINTYLKDCKTLIDPVKQEMAQHRDNNYLWANLGLAIASLGLFYLIAISVNKVSTGNWLFFSKPKSLDLAENLEESLNQVAAAAT